MRRRHGCCSSPGRQCSSSTVVLRLAAKARAAAAAPCGRQRSSSAAALRLAARKRERCGRVTGVVSVPGEASRRCGGGVMRCFLLPLRCCFFGFGAARGVSRELGRGARGAADASGSARAAVKPIFTLRWGCPAMQPFWRPGSDWASTQRLGMDEKCVPLVSSEESSAREVIVFTSPRQGQFLRAQRTAARQHLST